MPLADAAPPQATLEKSRYHTQDTEEGAGRSSGLPCQTPYASCPHALAVLLASEVPDSVVSVEALGFSDFFSRSVDGGEEEVWLSVLCCQLKSFYLLLELLYLLLELLASPAVVAL